MVLSVNPYSPTYTYGSLYPISKSTTGNLSAIGNHSANSSFFAKYVLHSKPYEQ
jgi:hypothetical protein